MQMLAKRTQLEGIAGGMMSSGVGVHPPISDHRLTPGWGHRAVMSHDIQGPFLKILLLAAHLRLGMVTESLVAFGFSEACSLILLHRPASIQT